MVKPISAYHNPPIQLADTVVAAVCPQAAQIAHSIWPHMRVVYEQTWLNGPDAGEIELFATIDADDLMESLARPGHRAHLITGWSWSAEGINAWQLTKLHESRKILSNYFSAATWRDHFRDGAEELDEAELAAYAAMLPRIPGGDQTSIRSAILRWVTEGWIGEGRHTLPAGTNAPNKRAAE